MARLTTAASLLCLRIVIISLSLAMPLQAEVIKVPVSKQAGDKQYIERPQRGLLKEQVRAKFGSPLSIVDPVGSPPISAWEYADYKVFFEYDRVLHSVIKHVAIPE